MVKIGPMRLRCLSAGSMCFAFFAFSQGEAQTVEGTPSHLTFDAASVKATPKDMGAFVRGGPRSSDPGRIMYHSTPWEFLLRRAFGVKPDQVECLGWMTNGTYYYDVDATIPPGTAEQQFRVMLQSLLVERFHLVYHVGARNFPGYELTVAPGRPKIQPSSQQTDNLGDASASRDPNQKQGQGVAGFPVLKPGQKYAVNSPPTLSEAGMFRATFHESIQEFLDYLPLMIMQSNRESGYPRYRVVDRTGLAGVFDFRVEFFGSTISQDPGGPSVFQALEHQLGLKLNKTKDIAVDVIVVDGAEKIPTEN